MLESECGASQLNALASRMQAWSEQCLEYPAFDVYLSKVLYSFIDALESSEVVHTMLTHLKLLYIATTQPP
jgi:hypothetical protein